MSYIHHKEEPCYKHLDTPCTIYLRGDKTYERLEKSGRFEKTRCKDCGWIIATSKSKDRKYIIPKQVKINLRPVYRPKGYKKTMKDVEVPNTGILDDLSDYMIRTAVISSRSFLTP